MANECNYRSTHSGGDQKHLVQTQLQQSKRRWWNPNRTWNMNTNCAEMSLEQLIEWKCWVRILVPASTQSWTLKSQWVGVRPLHPLLSH